MESLLKNLANFTVENWYKMLILLSFVLLMVALTMPIYAISNAALALMALGGCCVGFGEWMNHPYRGIRQPNSRHILPTRSRRNCASCVILVLAGVSLALVGVDIGISRYFF